jgi:hypothetical protein
MSKYTLPAEPFHLARGGHNSWKDGACFNELAAMLAGQPFSASPACVSPVIRRMGMTLNDRLDDDRRQLLRPFVLRSLGTAEDGRDGKRRELCAAWLLHEALPTLLEKADRKVAADRLRALPGDLAFEGVRRAIRDARSEALEARQTAVTRLSERIREALRERMDDGGVAADAAAVGVAAAVGAVGVADVAAVAADAVAGAAVAAVAAAAVDGAAGVVGAAVVAAVAAIAASAVADADTAAATPAARRGLYEVVYTEMRERFRAEPLAPELLDGALGLMDRMLPPSPLKQPVIEHAEVICAAP